MKLSQFNFKLPEELIALEPPCIDFYDEEGNVVEKVYHRDECRLMVVHRKSQKIDMDTSYSGISCSARQQLSQQYQDWHSRWWQE